MPRFPDWDPVGLVRAFLRWVFRTRTGLMAQDDKFKFHQVRLKVPEELRRDVPLAVGVMMLDFRAKVWAKDVYFNVTNI